MARICLVVGDSPDKWDDLEYFLEVCKQPFDIAVVNGVGFVFPCSDFRYWVTAHPNEILSKVSDDRVYSYRDYPGVRKVKVENISGSSGMTAVQLALHGFGYDLVVVAGISLAGKYKTFLINWRYVLGTDYAHRIKGTSGLVAKIFGQYSGG